MTREIITVQVGQCGNQVGLEFWDQAVTEQVCRKPEDSFSVFFSSSSSPPRARALLIDTEEGVVSSTAKSALGPLFDSTRQMITSVSGAGNNWAQGHLEYGSSYLASEIKNKLRLLVEDCDSLQGFLFLFSLGGGTGSGLGSKVVNIVNDNFASKHKFVNAIFPSLEENDDVITSPYNSLLALNAIRKSSDCILSYSNDALSRNCLVTNKPTAAAQVVATATTTAAKPCNYQCNTTAAINPNDQFLRPNYRQGTSNDQLTAFSNMNRLVAESLISLTSTMRFNGPLNIDMSDICTNMIPYETNNFITPALVSQTTLTAASMNRNNNATGDQQQQGKQGGIVENSIEQLFDQCLSPSTQLISADPRGKVMLTSSILLRTSSTTPCSVGRLMKSIQVKLKESGKIKLLPYLQDSWKAGLLCDLDLVNHPSSTAGLKKHSSPSLLCLYNTCAMSNVLDRLRRRFKALYSRKAHTHHYCQYGGFDNSYFEDALESCSEIISAYDGDELLHSCSEEYSKGNNNYGHRKEESGKLTLRQRLDSILTYL